MMDVLVLSKTWEPMDRISWEEAFTVLFAGEADRKAEVVEFDPHRVIRSGSPEGDLREWKVPSVIRFVNAMIPRLKNVRFSRENIYARDRGTCQYCGARVAPDDWEYEHVVPRSQGGRTSWMNIVVACTACNQKKANKTPAQAGMKLLAKPVKPDKMQRLRPVLAWQPGMPVAWKSYMRDATYWKGELQHD